MSRSSRPLQSTPVAWSFQTIDSSFAPWARRSSLAKSWRPTFSRMALATLASSGLAMCLPSASFSNLAHSAFPTFVRRSTFGATTTSRL